MKVLNKRKNRILFRLVHRSLTSSWFFLRMVQLIGHAWCFFIPSGTKRKPTAIHLFIPQSLHFCFHFWLFFSLFSFTVSDSCPCKSGRYFHILFHAGIVFLLLCLLSFLWQCLLEPDPALSFSCRFIILLHDSERVTYAQSLISRTIPDDSAITLRNIQSGNVVLGVLGLNSRQLLQTLTQTSLDVNWLPANATKVNIIYAA